MRSSTRQVHLAVPVLISGYDFCDEPFNEVTETSEVSVDGAFIALVTPIAREHPFLLINRATGGATSCRVASMEIAPNGKAHVGVRFESPSPEFWGIDFPSEELHPLTTRRCPEREVA